MNPPDTFSDRKAHKIQRGKPMLHLVVTLHTLGVTTLTRTQDRLAELKTNSDRGSVTLEQVIIALGLFLLAVAVVGGITAAVNSRLSRIS